SFVCRDASAVQTLSANPGRRPALLASAVLVLVAAGLVGGLAFDPAAPSPASASDADGHEPSHGAPRPARSSTASPGASAESASGDRVPIAPEEGAGPREVEFVLNAGAVGLTGRAEVTSTTGNQRTIPIEDGRFRVD